MGLTCWSRVGRVAPAPLYRRTPPCNPPSGALGPAVRPPWSGVGAQTSGQASPPERARQNQNQYPYPFPGTRSMHALPHQLLKSSSRPSRIQPLLWKASNPQPQLLLFLLCCHRRGLSFPQLRARFRIWLLEWTTGLYPTRSATSEDPEPCPSSSSSAPS